MDAGWKIGSWMRVGALAAALLLLTIAAPAAAADQAPTAATVFTRGYDNGRVVTLSFDADWWSPGDVPTVLRILRENGITASFGLTGRYVERFPDQARSIAAAGHKIINHSYDHPYFTGLTQAQRWSQLDRAEAAFARVGISSDGWFRAPYRDGYLDAGVNRDLALRGYFVNFDWTFDTTGYAGAPVDTILARVRQYTVPGATVLMHLSTESTDTAALPQVIATLRATGYGFTDPYRTVTRGAVGAAYAHLGAQASPLGPPRTGELVATVAGTAVQWFRTGRIYHSPGTGAHEVHGAIAGKYVALGSVGSVLRFPLSDEVDVPGGRGNEFEAGSIYWSPGTGAFEVHGLIRQKFWALGSTGSFLRFPVSDETAVPGGRGSEFQGGSIYWSPASGAHEVHGAIRARFWALGSTSSRLGFPVSDEYAVPGGRRSDFQGGTIGWSAATGSTTVTYR